MYYRLFSQTISTPVPSFVWSNANSERLMVFYYLFTTKWIEKTLDACFVTCIKKRQVQIRRIFARNEENVRCLLQKRSEHFSRILVQTRRQRNIEHADCCWVPLKNELFEQHPSVLRVDVQERVLERVDEELVQDVGKRSHCAVTFSLSTRLQFAFKRRSIARHSLQLCTGKQRCDCTSEGFSLARSQALMKDLMCSVHSWAKEKWKSIGEWVWGLQSVCGDWTRKNNFLPVPTCNALTLVVVSAGIMMWLSIWVPLLPKTEIALRICVSVFVLAGIWKALTIFSFVAQHFAVLMISAKSPSSLDSSRNDNEQLRTIDACSDQRRQLLLVGKLHDVVTCSEGLKRKPYPCQSVVLANTCAKYSLLSLHCAPNCVDSGREDNLMKWKNRNARAISCFFDGWGVLGGNARVSRRRFAWSASFPTSYKMSCLYDKNV